MKAIADLIKKAKSASIASGSENLRRSTTDGPSSLGRPVVSP